MKGVDDALPRQSRPELTQHATRRVAQRGSDRTLSFLFENGDVDLHAGGGCTAVSLSSQEARSLVEEGHPAGVVERAARKALVLNEEGRLVTVFPIFAKRGRRYRRQRETWRPGVRRHRR